MIPIWDRQIKPGLEEDELRKEEIYGCTWNGKPYISARLKDFDPLPENWDFEPKEEKEQLSPKVEAPKVEPRRRRIFGGLPHY